jgi:hypothetical protein
MLAELKIPILCLAIAGHCKYVQWPVCTVLHITKGVSLKSFDWQEEEPHFQITEIIASRWQKFQTSSTFRKTPTPAGSL